LHNYFNMAKVKYYYDTKTLSYKRIKLSRVNKVRNLFYFLIGSAFTGLVMVIIFFQFFDSPKEKILNREIKQLSSQYEVVQDKLQQVELVLDDIQERDDNIYRVIFEADPIPRSIRKAGYGGVNRYQDLSGYNNAELIISTAKKIDQITKQLYIQSKSFDNIIELAKNKADMLASMPAIQPVSNKDLSRMASGYGYRIHPIYKTKKFHAGMDFSAKTGTPIYATGDGKISKVRKSRRGYGNHVIIDHGFGYKTLYAHMSRYIVKRGQKVNRGDVIGYVGSSGTSVAPHLHYEVHKDGKKINPINFYYNDLTPDQYEKILELSSKSNQSFD
jgi:murein DD-endopeptidase MepM/ murein hydrolase activator NlpD